MKVTNILVAEHENILKVLDRLEVLNKASLRENLDEYAFILDFIQTYSDDYHHMKEEKIYFEWIANNSDSLKNGPVSCMLKEHDTFRDLTKNTKNALLAYSKDNDNQDAGNTVIGSLEIFASLLRAHIQKENEMLYPMAERLNEQKKNGDEQMLAAFTDVSTIYADEVEKFESYCQRLSS